MKKAGDIFFILSLLALTVLTACKENSNEGEEGVSGDSGSSSESAPIKPKEYEEEIEVIFQDSKANTPLEDSLLKAVNLCNPDQKDLKNYMSPSCNSKFFEVFPLVNKATMRDRFLVLCRSGVHGFPVRRVIVFEKENGTYMTTNTFVADLVAMEKSKNSEYKDLILQFMDTDENRFECRYTWREGRYAYDKVMKINGNRIKTQYLDSMKVEIGREISRLRLSY
ncbi:MAG: hypothetical protein J0G96_13875 [Flavobacteriia bacterium]|nr:hypothetical protein [Flavobacteriia bacterium]OJX39028.1 MAG: hypothetical protein BGO87_03305 [Flavobacteriia bacterium 40-80]